MKESLKRHPARIAETKRPIQSMPPKPETISRLMRARVQTASRTHRVVEAHFDAESGAAVLIGLNEKREQRALFFDPRVSRFFKEEALSAHERINLGAALRKRLREEREQDMAPHNIKVGDIFHIQSGATICWNSFFRVIRIPTPQSIEAVEMPVKVLRGNISQGTVVPDVVAPIPEGRTPRVLPIVMHGGQALLRTKRRDWRSSHGRVWDGAPKENYED